MGVSENVLNNLLIMYFKECDLYKSFEQNILSNDNDQINSKL